MQGVHRAHAIRLAAQVLRVRPRVDQGGRGWLTQQVSSSAILRAAKYLCTHISGSSARRSVASPPMQLPPHRHRSSVDIPSRPSEHARRPRVQSSSGRLSLAIPDVNDNYVIEMSLSSLRELRHDPQPAAEMLAAIGFPQRQVECILEHITSAPVSSSSSGTSMGLGELAQLVDGRRTGLDAVTECEAEAITRSNSTCHAHCLQPPVPLALPTPSSLPPQTTRQRSLSPSSSPRFVKHARCFVHCFCFTCYCA